MIDMEGCRGFGFACNISKDVRVERKATAAYVAVIVSGAVLCGSAINLLPDALPASSAIAASGHSLSVVHWASAAFLAIMMAYNMVRPVAMGHRKCSSK